MNHPATANTLAGKLLLGWMTRDEALVALCDASCFDPPMTKSGAEKLWEQYSERVGSLPPRPCDPVAELPLEEPEQVATAEFCSGAKAAGASNVAGVIKVRPRDLLIHQTHMVSEISQKYRDTVTVQATWARTCLGIGMLAGKVPIEKNGTRVTARLPHAEYRGIFTNQGQLNIVESQQMIGVVRVLGSLWLSSGYHRAYAALRSDNAPILAAIVTHPKVPDIVGSACAPRLSDFLDHDLSMSVNLWRVRYELQADLAARTSRVMRFRS